MSFFEVRTFVPPRTRDQVMDAVVVQVGEIRSFTPELIAELDSFERVQFVTDPLI